jgi:TRAP-type C4-dicarboxylate transport system permease small subunit
VGSQDRPRRAGDPERIWSLVLFLEKQAGSRDDRLRKFLDSLYLGSGVLAAVFLAGIGVLMLVQIIGRELGYQVRGADDLTAWFCAASAFLPLAHTFKRGELVRVGLLLERLQPAARRSAELFSLGLAAVFIGYMAWSVTRFVYQSWELNDVAQGMLPLPMWIPQSSFALGVIILFIAIADELVLVIRKRTPTYVLAGEERLASGDFGESI